MIPYYEPTHNKKTSNREGTTNYLYHSNTN